MQQSDAFDQMGYMQINIFHSLITAMTVLLLLKPTHYPLITTIKIKTHYTVIFSPETVLADFNTIKQEDPV